ncbi:MAG: LytTR family DNA-binding domain-containing protein [Bacteroidales bacterium]
MNSAIHAIVVDDEEPSREALKNYISDFCIDVEVVATASSVKTAYKAIQKHKPDLVFLDIEMPDGKGFDLLKMFEVIDFRVIFVTAYSEYAIKAFRVNAVDYLLKPVKIDELKNAVEKIKAGNGDSQSEKLSVILKEMSDGIFFSPTLIVSNVKGHEVLKVNEIIMCKADGYCTIFYLTGDRKVNSSRNLKQFETQIMEYGFIRVHNSFLVNMHHVCSFTKQGEIILTENNKAFLGDRYKSHFMKLFSRK